MQRRVRGLRDGYGGAVMKSLLRFVMLLFNHYIFCHRMSNPFEYFANDDDDEKFTPTSSAAEQKPKRTHAEKRAYK
jgi:hypothetical protein